MTRLGDVGCMEVVVVLDILQVVVLQGHQEAEQGGSWDLEGAKEVSLLQDPVNIRDFKVNRRKEIT